MTSITDILHEGLYEFLWAHLYYNSLDINLDEKYLRQISLQQCEYYILYTTYFFLSAAVFQTIIQNGGNVSHHLHRTSSNWLTKHSRQYNVLPILQCLFSRNLVLINFSFPCLLLRYLALFLSVPFLTSFLFLLISLSRSSLLCSSFESSSPLTAPCY